MLPPPRCPSSPATALAHGHFPSCGGWILLPEHITPLPRARLWDKHQPSTAHPLSFHPEWPKPHVLHGWSFMAGAELLSPTPHSAYPEPHISPRSVPTPQTHGHRHQRGVTAPKIPLPAQGTLCLEGSQLQRVPRGQGSTASCLLPLASSNTARPGERAADKDGNSHPSGELQMLLHLLQQLGKFHARGEKELKVRPPLHASFWGKKTKILSSGVAQRSSPLLSEVQ